MVKTLKITTFFIAVLALGVIIFIAAKGLASDKAFDKFLAAPGIAEQLQTGSVDKKAPDVDQETPLIRQARAFALRINPPPPPPPPRMKMPVTRGDPRPKATVTAKFKLVGTSYHIGDEKNSWALIDEVGKGWHWVRQNEKIGHLVVEGIGDGVVLIRDGSETYVLAAERKEKPDYVQSFTGTVAEKIIPSWQDTQNTVSEAVSTDRTGVLGTENAQNVQPGPTKEDIQGNIDWLKQLQENPESLGMTDEEAKEIRDLGNLLEALETELKTAESNEPNAAIEPNSAEIKDVNEQKSSSEVTAKQQSEPNEAAPEPSRKPFKRDRR